MSTDHQTSPQLGRSTLLHDLQAKYAVLIAERDELIRDRDRLDAALQGMWRMWQERLTEQEQDEATEAAMDAMQKSGRLAT